MRELCFAIIRGRRTPLSFKIVLSLAPENFAAFLEKHQIGACRAEDIQGLYLNFHYDGTTLQCITGTSMHTFTMDKTLEREWDAYVGKMLGNGGSCRNCGDWRAPGGEEGVPGLYELAYV